MRGIPSPYLFAFFSITLFIELLAFGGIITIFPKSKKRLLIFTILYFLISTVLFVFNIYAFSNPEVIRRSSNYQTFNLLILANFLNLIPKAFFAICTVLSYLLRLLSKKSQAGFLLISLILSISVFVTIGVGAFYGRYQIEIKVQHIFLDSLPTQLDGLKIVQISDLHLGSFKDNSSFMLEAVKKVNEQNADLLLFTGDIVNNFAYEIDGFESYLQEFSARLGKYAILGNHDYGDYSEWPNQQAKNNNFEQTERKISQAGFKLLLNQSVKIQVKDTSFFLVGVENWGHRPFPQYADLEKSLKDVPQKSFKILMSHDPAHWEALVVPQTDIPLTLAGHTHGGQFGIKIAGIEFSPIYLIQKYWGGLYKSDNQYLYVNRGLGTIGFPGRIEMNPEITVLVLQHAIKTPEN